MVSINQELVPVYNSVTIFVISLVVVAIRHILFTMVIWHEENFQLLMERVLSS